MNIKIESCKKCFFFHDGQDGHSVRHHCTHPKANYRDLDAYRSGWDGWNVKGGSPDWCPLKTESLLIEFGKETKK